MGTQASSGISSMALRRGFVILAVMENGALARRHAPTTLRL
jgi:hypothetical protein